MEQASEGSRPRPAAAGEDEGRREDEVWREPENSTVEDWLGQRVGRDEARAERLLEEVGGDEARAAERFEEESEADAWHEAHVQGSAAAPERPQGSD